MKSDQRAATGRHSTYARSAEKRRLAYTLAAGAAVAAGGREADAAVEYFTGEFAIAHGNFQELDINGDTITDVYLKNYLFNHGNYQGVFVRYAPGQVVGFKTASPNPYYVTALTAGALIDATTVGPNFLGSLSYGANNPQGQFNNVTNAYIGLSFPQGDNLYYGWIRVDVNNAAGTFFLHDWAFEDVSGMGIHAGDKGVALTPGDFNTDGKVDGADFLSWQRGVGTTFNAADLADWKTNFGAGAAVSALHAVAEPATLGMLAAGSAGLLLLRRLRGPRP